MFLVGLVFILLAVFAGVFFAHLVYKARQALSWPSVRGTVVESRIARDSSEDIPYPEVIFSYQVNGHDYTGRTLSFTKNYTNPGEVVKHYNPGREIDVYYNPAEPSDSVLEVDTHIKIRPEVIIAIILFLATGLSLLFH